MEPNRGAMLATQEKLNRLYKEPRDTSNGNAPAKLKAMLRGHTGM
jgi:hypothetical protein